MSIDKLDAANALIAIQERELAELRAKLAEAGRDAERLAYLTADHDDAAVRKRRNELLHRMPTMSHSAACADIDIGLAAIAAERKEEGDCAHGKGLTDYCKPCGRIHD